MPNPGSVTSLQAFDKETVNTVVHIPDYKLRQQLAVHLGEEVVVEAFAAHEDLFFLHLSWKDDVDHPTLGLSAIGAGGQKIVLDITVQSPHFAYTFGTNSGGQQPWMPTTWSTNVTPIEMQTTRGLVPLHVDRPPTYHNERGLTMAQTVTFTMTGTLWKLDNSLAVSLQCKSYRLKAEEMTLTRGGATGDMASNVCAMRSQVSERDMKIVLDDEEESPRFAHAFVLQAQSPVLRRMLTAPMRETTERRILMCDVSARQLDDFLEAMYSMGVSAEVGADEDRLVELLEIADRYEVSPIRDECGALLEARLCEENLGRLLQVADRHHAEALRSAALEFAMSRLERIATVMDTDDRGVRASMRDYLNSAQAERGERLRNCACFDTNLLVLTV
eukprot:TRINITY_DN26376_c0_g1_i1.p1 TRINITY_DN26376_c0_g1~~TRINITY_DN26376_c0_g1_i1.p1  ORF type:complete len:389 (-),score=80.17 TRINITY_DN26376_c0_g1_i1:64-1230(-)